MAPEIDRIGGLAGAKPRKRASRAALKPLEHEDLEAGVAICGRCGGPCMVGEYYYDPAFRCRVCGCVDYIFTPALTTPRRKSYR